MESELIKLVTDAGAVGLLAAVLWTFNRHVTTLLANHEADRKTWLESMISMTTQLTKISEDVKDIKEKLEDR